MTWEIHVYQGENQGLVFAEIELPREDTRFEKPDWMGQEITSDPCYSNVGLARTQYRKWTEKHAG